jgi:hypothetical protein
MTVFFCDLARLWCFRCKAYLKSGTVVGLRWQLRSHMIKSHTRHHTDSLSLLIVDLPLCTYTLSLLFSPRFCESAVWCRGDVYVQTQCDGGEVWHLSTRLPLAQPWWLQVRMTHTRAENKQTLWRQRERNGPMHLKRIMIFFVLSVCLYPMTTFSWPQDSGMFRCIE